MPGKALIRKTSLLQDRPDGERSGSTDIRALRAACAATNARIDLLFTMSDNPCAPPRGERTRMSCADEQHCTQDQSRLVEPDGIEPTTSCLQSRRSPN